MFRVIAPLVAVLVLLAGCGGHKQNDSPTPTDPVRNVPNDGGIQNAVREASTPTASDFPAADGKKSLQEIASGMVSGPSLAMASSVFTTPGATRMAFGMVSADG